jgi:hypothetical protein
MTMSAERERFVPARGKVLVRPIETDEAMPGARVVLLAETRERLTAWQVEVVAVGEWAWCDDEDCQRIRHAWDRESDRWMHEHDVVAGDWVLIRPRSALAGPDSLSDEWIVGQDDLWAIFRE